MDLFQHMHFYDGKVYILTHVLQFIHATQDLNVNIY